MLLANVRKLRGIIRRWNIPSINLLGGEPTLHSQFKEVIKEFQKERLPMYLFTNGLVKQDLADFIRDTEEIHTIMLNLNPPGEYTATQEETIYGFTYECTSRNKDFVVGVNVFRPDFNGEYAINFMNDFDIKLARIGLANPLCNSDGVPHNKFIEPRDFRKVAQSVVDFSTMCFNNDIYLTFDCVVPWCMFTEAQLGRLYKQTARLEAACEPIIDVGTDLKVWRCFATSNFHNDKYIDDFESLDDVMEHFTKAFLKYQDFGGFKECETCRHHHMKQCQGGCIGYSILRYNAKTYYGV
jgi:hypothetical protein